MAFESPYPAALSARVRPGQLEQQLDAVNASGRMARSMGPGQLRAAIDEQTHQRGSPAAAAASTGWSSSEAPCSSSNFNTSIAPNAGGKHQRRLPSAERTLASAALQQQARDLGIVDGRHQRCGAGLVAGVGVRTRVQKLTTGWRCHRGRRTSTA